MGNHEPSFISSSRLVLGLSVLENLNLRGAVRSIFGWILVHSNRGQCNLEWLGRIIEEIRNSIVGHEKIYN